MALAGARLMAAPLSAADVVSALRAEGVRVVQVGNWRTHNRNHKGAWGPVNGSIVHHSVTRGTAATVALCRDGHSALPGPLCHGVIAKDGTVHMVGWGRTNHAGGGDPKVLAEVVAESYGARPTPPTRGNADGVDGNSHFYGWECENLGDGRDPWPADQYDAIVRVQAALCRAHGWSAKSVIGHLEWSSDKVDPRGFSMAQLRADVAERLTHPASWNPGSTPSEEDDMPTPLQFWNYRNKNAKGKIPDAYGYLTGTAKDVDALTVKVDALTKAVAALTALVKKG